MIFENEIVFPSDIIINSSNQSIFREIVKSDLSKLNKPVYVLWTSFDTIEFSTTLFERTKDGIMTVKHRPKRDKLGYTEWSWYYDRFIKEDKKNLKVYHTHMRTQKKYLHDYLDRFYNPFYEIDNNLCLIKTVKNLFDANGVNYRFVKPSRKKYYYKNYPDNDFFDTAEFEVTDYLEKHELYHILKGPEWMPFNSFYGKYESEIKFLISKERMSGVYEDGFL
jgi:hypothetical protein